MLKHDILIKKLTTEQKIKFVISGQNLKRESIPEFVFSPISVETNPLANRNGYFTCFPSLKALAASWNVDLFKKGGKYCAIENNYGEGANLFDLTFADREKSVSEDYFMNGQFLKSYISGVKEGDGISCVKLNSSEDCINYENKYVQFDYAAQSEPQVVLVDSVEDIEFLAYNNYDFNKTIFANANSKNSAVALLQEGASLVFVSPDLLDEAVEHAILAFNTYPKALFDLNNGNIDEAQFKAMQTKGFILSEDRLNSACDDLVDILVKIDDYHKNPIAEPIMKFYEKDHKVLFDEYGHDAFSYETAKQSIVLLKNDEVLPFGHKDKVAVFGDFAKNDYYAKKFSGRSEIYSDLIFDRINDYEELNAIGYVHGYLADIPVNQELLHKAGKLVKNCDYALVFLSPDAKENVLPQSQLELLKKIKEQGKKIVAVVVAQNFVDLSFADMCSAVLFAYDCGQGLARAVLDILSGRISPCGKLIETSLEENVEFLPAYCGKKTLYPFGHGLSYTNFLYSNFSVNSVGASVTIENVGKYDAYETVQLYISKPGSKSAMKYKQLKGFVKVFIPHGKKEKVFIPFDDSTFNVYDEKKGCFVIEGGSYKVTVGSSIKTVRAEATIKVRKYENRVLFANKVIIEKSGKRAEGEVNKFAYSADGQRFVRKNLKLSTAAKVGLCLFMIAYFNIVAGLIVFSRARYLPNMLDNINVIVLGVDLFVSFISFISMLIFLGRRHRKKYVPYGYVNDTLTNVIERAEEFKEEGRITYIEYAPPAEPEPQPVETPVYEEPEIVEEVIEEPVVEQVEEIEEEVIEEVEEPVVLEEIQEVQEEFNVLNSVPRDDIDNNDYEEVSIFEIYENFNEFLKSKGLNLDAFSVRSIVTSVLTSNIIFIDTYSKDISNRIIAATQEFFSCDVETTQIPTSISSIRDLLVDELRSSPEATSFASRIYKAENTDKFNIMALNGVYMNDSMSYLSDFVALADNPSIDRNIKVDSASVTLKRNTVLFIVPEEENFTEIMPEALARSSVSIFVKVKENYDELSYDKPIKLISYSKIQDLIDDAKDLVYINEETWKKFDQLEDLINEKEGFELGNKLVIFIEKFTSTFMECHGEDYQATDALICIKLLPILKKTALYNNVSGDTELQELLEKIFEVDNLEKTSKYIKKIVDETVVEQPVLEQPFAEEVSEQPIEEFTTFNPVEIDSNFDNIQIDSNFDPSAFSSIEGFDQPIEEPVETETVVSENSVESDEENQ